MGFLKVDIVNGAFERLGISGITTEPELSEINDGLLRLESMAAEFFNRNMDVGYMFEDSPDPNSESGVPIEYKNAFEANLARRLVPDYGRASMAPQDVIALQNEAVQSLSTMAGQTFQVREVVRPNRQPRGSGSTLRYNRWQRYYRPQEKPPISSFTNSLSTGDINDYVEHYDAYLMELEDLQSFTIAADTGLTVVSSEIDPTTLADINYRIEAGTLPTTSNGFLTVRIVATTTNGRVTSRTINFSVNDPC